MLMRTRFKLFALLLALASALGLGLLMVNPARSTEKAVSAPAQATQATQTTQATKAVQPVAPAQAAQPEKPNPTALSSKSQDIVFQGKIYCSLKRYMPVPYKGIITQLNVQVGRKVLAGEVLLKLQLDPEVVASLRRRVSPSSIDDLEVRLAQILDNLVTSRAKLHEVEELSRQRMASPQTVTQVNQNIELLERQQRAIQQQLNAQRRSLQDDLVALSDQLGETINSDKIPLEVLLRAPIDGHIIWLHPELRVGAEIDPQGGTAGITVGVMEPMLIRANIFESEASRVTPGDQAEVTLSSLPGSIFKATLSRVSWTPATPGLDQPSYYEVELTVPNPDLVLKEGFKVQVTMQ